MKNKIAVYFRGNSQEKIENNKRMVNSILEKNNLNIIINSQLYIDNPLGICVQMYKAHNE